MNTKVFLGMVMTVLFPIYAFGECSLDGNQSQMTACATQYMEKAENEMDKLLQAQLSRLSDEKKQELIKAQFAWELFRDQSCEYTISSQGGSMYPMEQAMCRERFANERIETLRTYLDCVSDIYCPN